MTAQAEDAIIHLANALMPTAPCEGCDPIMMLWKDDRNIPDQITIDRSNALFGVQEGAYRAWIYAMRNRHFRTTFI
jgi:hypothetical protein